MADSVPYLIAKKGTTPVDQHHQTSAVDLLDLLRRAVAHAGETHESLAAYLQVSDRSYPFKLLQGDKPLSLERFGRWPRPVLRAFAALLAAECGLQVAEPARTEAEARAQLVSALSYLVFPTPMVKVGVTHPYRGEERRRA